jgi:formiminoglutamate deiminase
MPSWWARHAWLGGISTTGDVLLEVKDDRFVAVTAGITDPPVDATRLDGLTLPGLANVHSHAFHRALRGRTQVGVGSFWAWRDLMYSVADRLDPDSYLRLATAVYAEMALAGFTAVGEFHYLHHQRGGVAYQDPNEMGRVLMTAAAAAGIRLTLLDACYLQGGFDTPLGGAQLRFGDGTVGGWIERVQQLQPEGQTRLGGAIHSVRAVPPLAIAEAVEWLRLRKWLLHAHVSEQRREQNESRYLRGATPLGVLAAAGAVGPRFTAIHGTHMTKKDIAGLAAEGGGCCLCPTTERDLGDGVGPGPALHRAGVPLSIGTDSHAMIDGFEEARAIELDSRLVAEQRGVLDAGVLLHAATANGMDALGWDAGRLAAGRLADFFTVRLDTIRTAGSDPSLAATAVFAATAADVDLVVVGGHPVVSGGVHLGVPDAAHELAAAIAGLFP